MDEDTDLMLGRSAQHPVHDESNANQWYEINFRHIYYSRLTVTHLGVQFCPRVPSRSKAQEPDELCAGRRANKWVWW